MLQRLQKIIARAGVASRRHAEQLILAGQVRVNGQIVTALGSKADPERDSIRVGGKVLRGNRTSMYLAFHKPAACVATMSDPEGRASLGEFLRGLGARVFPIGRLDFHASGLLLLTNDGDFANRMLRAAGRLPQVYWLKTKGALQDDVRREVERRTGARLRVLKVAQNAWYEGLIPGARRDLVRQALAQLGHPVEKLKRVELAGVELASIPPGHYRHLSRGEVALLDRAASRASAGNTPPHGPRRPRIRAARRPRRGLRKGTEAG